MQTDSSLLDYYPLQIGNRWDYEDKFEDFGKDTTILKYFSLKIVGDTTMSNAKTYQVVRRQAIPDTMPHTYFYERIDSTSFSIFRYDIHDDSRDSDELFVDSLRLIVTGGEFEGYSRENQFSAIISYIGEEVETLLGSPMQLQRFHANDIVNPKGFDYWFAKDIGLVRGLLTDTLWRNPITLIYAEIDGRSLGLPVSVEGAVVEHTSFRLFQNYPNPFNPATTIPYELAKGGEVQLAVYNLLGQRIRLLFNGFQAAGFHRAEFDATDLPSSVYVYEIRFGSLAERKKLLLLK